MKVAHSTVLTILVNWSIPFLAIAAAIGVVAFFTRGRTPKADDAKSTRRH